MLCLDYDVQALSCLPVDADCLVATAHVQHFQLVDREQIVLLLHIHLALAGAHCYYDYHYYYLMVLSCDCRMQRVSWATGRSIWLQQQDTLLW